MYKKLLVGGLAASAVAVGLAALGWADPPPTPNTNAPTPATAAPNVTAEAPPAGPALPACMVSASTPVQGPPGTVWVLVSPLQGPIASQLGLPAGQTLSVYCAPAGSPNVAERPSNPSQTSAPPTPAAVPPTRTAATQ